MATKFAVPTERRYAQYKRRYLVEYTWDRRLKAPESKGSCATLHSARKHAVDACDIWLCTSAKIFDRKIGQYVMTYIRRGSTTTRYEGEQQ